MSARWTGADYALPAIRGVKPGAAQADVVAAFYSRSTEYPSYTAQDINPAVDDTWMIDETAPVGGFALMGEQSGLAYLYGWCTLDSPDEWREYRSVFYHLDDGFVASIDLNYSSDPE